MALVHHDEAVAQTDGVVHVVRDHQRGEVVLGDDLFGEIEDLGCGFGVKCCGVLVKQQQLGLCEGGHQQGEGLTLSARKQTDLSFHARIETQVELLEECRELSFFFFGDTPGKTAMQAAALGKCQVFDNLHVGGGATHRVLEHAAKILGALGFGHARNVFTVELDYARIERVHTGDHIEQRGLAGAVATDHGNEVAVVKDKVNTGKGTLLGDSALVERLFDVGELKHPDHLPSSRSCAVCTSPKRRGCTGQARR